MLGEHKKAAGNGKVLEEVDLVRLIPWNQMTDEGCGNRKQTKQDCGIASLEANEYGKTAKQVQPGQL